MLNENQRLAVETIEGPLLIIAGPGTGKTFTLVERVKHMVFDKNIDPSTIMLTTFTNKASLELIDRLSISFQKKEMDINVNDMLIGNFHSICREILEDNIAYTDLDKSYYTLDHLEQKYFIYRNIHRFHKLENYKMLLTSQNKYSIKKQVTSIQKYVNTVSEYGVLERKSKDKQSQAILDLVSEYEACLMENNLIDYSRILLYTYKLLKENHNILEKTRKRSQYIMVDEYQDTNKIQEKIIFLLGNHENIAVVGDDDQGLYRFRGASVENILDFPNKFKSEGKIIHLNENYRSNQDIINFYNEFMREAHNHIPSFNNHRYDKKIVGTRDNKESVFSIESENEEKWIIDNYNFIYELKRRKKITSYNQIAFLFSSLNDPRVIRLKDYFIKQGIKVYTPTLSTLLSRKEIHQLIAVLYILFEYDIKKHPKHRTSSLDKNIDIAKVFMINQIERDKEFNNFIKEMQVYLSSEKFSITIKDLVYRIFRYDPFKSYLLKEDMKEAKNISRFLDLLHSFSIINILHIINEDEKDRFIRLFFLEYLDFLLGERVEEFDEDTVVPDEDHVSFLTIHKSKGLEYPIVVVASLWENPYILSYKSQEDKNLRQLLSSYYEESREPSEYNMIIDFYRKYYTAFSRAQNLLILSGYKGSYYKNNYRQSYLSSHFKSMMKKINEFKAEAISNLDIDPINPANSKKIYSYTKDISVYNKCPLYYKFFRKLNFKKDLSTAMAYGSLVHESIEYLYITDRYKEDNLYRIVKNLVLSNARNQYRLGAYELDKLYIDRAINEVLNYMKSNHISYDNLYSEFKIRHASQEYILEGNIDLLLEKEKEFYIYDIKTGIPPNITKESLYKSNYHKQLLLYSYLFNETSSSKVTEIGLIYTDSRAHPRLYSLDNNEELRSELLNSINKTIELIEEENFYKTDKLVECISCPMRFLCDRVIVD